MIYNPIEKNTSERIELTKSTVCTNNDETIVLSQKKVEPQLYKI